MRSLSEISAALDTRGFGEADLSEQIARAFRLEAGAVRARKEGDTLVIASRDKTAKCALRGMEGEILAWLRKRGHEELRRVTWSVG